MAVCGRRELSVPIADTSASVRAELLPGVDERESVFGGAADDLGCGGVGGGLLEGGAGGDNPALAAELHGHGAKGGSG